MVKGKDDYAAVAEELGTQIVALQECNRVLWGGLAMILDRHGFLPKENFAKFFMSVAGQAHTHPNPEVGKLCSALLKVIAEDIADPAPKARWTPESISGWKARSDMNRRLHLWFTILLTLAVAVFFLWWRYF